MGRLHRTRWGRAIQRFADEELSTSRATTVARHLDGCPGCAGELEVLRRMKASLARIAERRPADVVVARLRAEAARLGAA